MASLSFEAWVLICVAGGAGIVGALYGVSCILERELLKVRLRVRTREVLLAHRRKMAAIARGEIEASLSGEELTMPVDAH